MNRRDWLTLFLALEGAPDGLDPVRIQKGMFLFSMEAHVPKGEKYSFKPYDYGPMSATIYRDLDALVASGVAVRAEVPGRRWAMFSATDAGLRAGRQVLVEARNAGHFETARTLQGIKQRVASLPFNELLMNVYDRYPEYAVNSVFRRSA